MAVKTMRRAFGSIPRHDTLQLLQGLLQRLSHLLHIAISFILLPFDNAVLLAACLVGYALHLVSRSSPSRRRKAALGTAGFYPKTVLVTGIDTHYGLAVARAWYYQGHRVVGVNITHTSIRPGEGMSRTIAAFYSIPKAQYVSRLLDLIHREKVDIWVPCSDQLTVMEDAMAKEVVESRTDCKCIHLDTELAARFNQPESFLQYLVEKDLPVVETHQVQSRASIHKILHRSPSKIYHMRSASSLAAGGKVVVLPKRTLSLTYSEVSEIQISKDRPWMLQQQTRLGTYYAELLVVRGFVKAITIRPSNHQLIWGRSRLDEALAIAIRKLMERFAMQGGPRMTGHLCVELMIDEEFDTNSVRHVIHIAGCTQGAAAVKTLLLDASGSFPAGCLSVLSPQAQGSPAETTNTHIGTMMCRTPVQNSKFDEALQARDFHRLALIISEGMQVLDCLNHAASQFVFWKNWRYSHFDPLPWWWDVHIYQPIKHFEMAFEKPAAYDKNI
ncbi:uncharacterized protein ACLA_010100 [Aspergillus clavatus NRRL 1]|uniref:ATP-grasp domain-containing protein n=1 Tax=Aspergillus clavatus (strain ATCC 1007 / CBS 513.65 / DSM 816 / NCTC 3887 / NRRL 1 / QM 1276 / 107) TaxID=344612 RepID=A1CA19_ASPCL|nr:uncharacterized protein ACLA_010100 [Aspergillus clavatus NRRL 1]EAW12587.1 conserved hypothetical protein [Aspergillus clavatus NRRL 1]